MLFVVEDNGAYVKDVEHDLKVLQYALPQQLCTDLPLVPFFFTPDKLESGNHEALAMSWKKRCGSPSALICAEFSFTMGSVATTLNKPQVQS